MLRDVRRSPGPRRRRAGGGARRRGRTAAAARTARIRSSSGRPGGALHRGYAAGLPILRRALDVFGIGMSVDEKLRWYWVAGIVAPHVWDDDRWHLLTDRHVQLARDVGALSELPMALSARAFMLLFAGELAGAASLVQEMQAAMEATGSQPRALRWPGPGGIARPTSRGGRPGRRDHRGRKPARRGQRDSRRRVGDRRAEQRPRRLRDGDAAAQRATAHPGEIVSPSWAAVELIEAAARSGDSDDRSRRAAPARRDDQCQRHRLGARRRGSFAGAAE